MGYPEDQRLTLKSLGLNKLNQSVVKDDSQSLRGMIIKVRHLVTIEEASQ
ncbi:MAG: 50S ribosomal protein L30 [Dehalococcoidales bacterium]|nr:50S ribosomal protein L30 [Dehalococcoidales bacterium]